MTILRIDDFAGAVNDGFDMALGEATMALTLVEVAQLPVHPFPGMLRAPFALVFRSGQAVILPQRIYRLRHDRLGALDVFLVPTGRDMRGALYHAVFN
ncbi:hypothetical protein VH567_14565 [Sphingomonas sp. 4RDLI-65]|uniref:DUF6916 family protein n=1 Tax=Sphingomonas sp. 4RDLI-65 TaxID=3111641 RepID=UPI003C17F880